MHDEYELDGQRELALRITEAGQQSIQDIRDMLQALQRTRREVRDVVIVDHMSFIGGTVNPCNEVPLASMDFASLYPTTMNNLAFDKTFNDPNDPFVNSVEDLYI